MRASESMVLIPVIEPKDYGSAGIDSDSFHTGRLHECDVYITFGAITGNSILTINSGATTGAKTTALAFKYRFSQADYKTAISGATGPDSYGDATSVAAAGLTLTAATFDHRTIVIALDSDQMTDAQPWVTISIDATASVMLVASVGIGRPRFPGHTIPSVC